MPPPDKPKPFKTQDMWATISVDAIITQLHFNEPPPLSRQQVELGYRIIAVTVCPRTVKPAKTKPR